MPYAIEGLEQTLRGLRKFSPELYKEVNQKITNLHWAVSKTNEIF